MVVKLVLVMELEPKPLVIHLDKENPIQLIVLILLSILVVAVAGMVVDMEEFLVLHLVVALVGLVELLMEKQLKVSILKQEKL